MEHQSLSLDGKTILSSSSGPTSPEEISKHDDTSPNIHSTSGINFSKSDTSSDDMAPITANSFEHFHQQFKKRTPYNDESSNPFKNLLPSPDMLVSFLAKKSLQQNQKKQHNQKSLSHYDEFPSGEILFKEPINSETTMISSSNENNCQTTMNKNSEKQMKDNPLDLLQQSLMNRNNNNGGNGQLRPSSNSLTENSECWRQFQKAAYAHNLDPNVLALYQNQSPQLNSVNGTNPAQGKEAKVGSIRRKNATRETTSMLKAWLNEHRKNPYPTKGEKIMLAIITKMSLTQVSTWFANARRRLKKENKVTWTIRSGSNFDDADESEAEDCCDDEDLGLFENNLPGQKRNIQNHSEEEKPTKQSKMEASKKKKIWSLVEMTKDHEDPDEQDDINRSDDEVNSTPDDGLNNVHQNILSQLSNNLPSEAISKWLESSQMPGNLLSNMPSILAMLSGNYPNPMKESMPPLLKMAKATDFSASSFTS